MVDAEQPPARHRLIESTSRRGYRGPWVPERNLPCPSKAHKSLLYRRIGFSPVGAPGLHGFPDRDCSQDFQLALRNSFPLNLWIAINSYTWTEASRCESFDI